MPVCCVQSCIRKTYSSPIHTKSKADSINCYLATERISCADEKHDWYLLVYTNVFCDCVCCITCWIYSFLLLFFATSGFLREYIVFYLWSSSAPPWIFIKFVFVNKYMFIVQRSSVVYTSRMQFDRWMNKFYVFLSFSVSLLQFMFLFSLPRFIQFVVFFGFLWNFSKQHFFFLRLLFFEIWKLCNEHFVVMQTLNMVRDMFYCISVAISTL